VVISITLLLASFLIVGLWPQKDKAMRSNTQAMIDAISAALASYYSEFHDYPPDGYDREPAWLKAGAYTGAGPGIMLGGGPSGNKRYQYYGSGCLIYFLCYPIANVTIVGADQGATDPRNLRISPCNKGSAFLTTLKKENFSASYWDDTFDIGIQPGNGQYIGTWAQGEIVDAYFYPIHYDKVGSDANDAIHWNANAFRNMSYPFAKIHSDQNYMTSIQGRIDPTADTEANACPSGQHGSGGTGGPKHADPRVPAESDGCYIDTPTSGNTWGPRNPGSFDLWAHGKCWANGITAITNWK